MGGLQSGSPFLFCADAQSVGAIESFYSSPKTAGAPSAFYSSLTGNAEQWPFSPVITKRKTINNNVFSAKNVNGGVREYI